MANPDSAQPLAPPPAPPPAPVADVPEATVPQEVVTAEDTAPTPEVPVQVDKATFLAARLRESLAEGQLRHAGADGPGGDQPA
jgi:hypothetical protein